MQENEERKSRESEEPGLLQARSVSRREFLKLAGIGGDTVAMGAGLGGLVAACGGSTTTTTAATTPTTAGPTTTAGGPSTTSGPTTTAGAVAGRDIKIGLVNALTGSLAPFAASDNWMIDKWKAFAANGIVLGDNQSHKFQFIVGDSQSDSNRAAQVTGDLINNSKVDMVMVSSSPDTVSPTADQCEALGTPMIANFVPWQPFYFRSANPPANGYKWTYAHAIGLEQLQDEFTAIWASLSTNKTVGALFPNDADGNAWRSGWDAVWAAKGLKWIDGGSFQDGSEDYSSQIAKFKNAGCEIVMGVLIPPDFVNFWKQAVQQGFKPKIATIGKALLFQSAVEAAGSIAYNVTVEGAWHRSYPSKSSLTGETADQLAADFESTTGKQWIQPIGQYAKFEWCVDIFKRTTNVDDKEEVIKNVAATKMDTVLGHIDFTSPVAAGTDHPVPNVYRAPLSGCQWVKGTKYFTDLAIVDNTDYPAATVTAKTLPMQYS